MIKLVTGSIFDSECEALVNPINCTGVQGAGLAKEFSKRYPENASIIRLFASQDKLNPIHRKIRIGSLIVNQNVLSELGTTKHIINFPTKKHWKNPSEYEHIRSGLIALCSYLNNDNFIPTVAMPMLGCGLGKLQQERVMQLFQEYLQEIKTEFYIYNYNHV
jgi:O-acetyl-ADP-ribose deacetylase (regulator of RNase III)